MMAMRPAIVMAFFTIVRHHDAGRRRAQGYPPPAASGRVIFYPARIGFIQQGSLGRFAGLRAETPPSADRRN